MDDPEILIQRIYRKVDDFFVAARTAQPEAFCCEVGCTACCEVDLTVFFVEARRIESAFKKLSEPVRREAAGRAARALQCAMLDPQTSRCIVYDSRPLICRSHGLAVLTDDRIDHCQLNYVEEKPEPEHIMTLERVNELLVLTNRLAGGDGSRVRLADIATRRSG